MIKKGIFVTLLIVFLCFVYSTGNAKNVSLDKIEDSLKINTNIEKLEKQSNRDLLQFMSMDYEQLNSYIYYKNNEALSVEELLIVKVDDKSQLNSIKDACETRINTQISTFEGYGPNQVALLKDAVIKTKGNYLFYCVSKSSDNYEEVFKDAI